MQKMQGLPQLADVASDQESARPTLKIVASANPRRPSLQPTGCILMESEPGRPL
jgi:hypothetical protein